VKNGSTFELVELPAIDDIGRDVGFFTSYAKDGRFITFYGDNHPTYAGNVVKAMGSAKQGYPTVSRVLSALPACPAPDDTAFKAAAVGADWAKSYYQILTNQPGKDAWPITGATFILMHGVQDKPAQATATLKFFDWAYKNGDKTADDLDYVPMPDSVKAVIAKGWSEIKDASGKSVAVR
jgi:hypothetical protein